MEKGKITQEKTEKVVLVGIIRDKTDERQTKEYLDELQFLAETAGAQTLKIFTQRMAQPDKKTFVGSGKLAQIKEYCTLYKVDTLIFDDELTPSQMRNIEREIELKVIDRTHLILDIFAQRATTAYSKTQVELAQCQYLLPRLTGMWTHLERQKGGIGMRGPGETEIETDRRIIRDKISKLKEQLSKIDRQMSVQRGNRGELIRVALVGYTNVGKSTLMNLLSKSEVFAENKLFATLDTTVRKVVIENVPFLMCDTVGFIRKLPHQLVESFKSTLDEVREADLLLHVIDISHPAFEEQIEVVNSTLKEIGAGEKPMLYVFNKVDAFSHTPKESDDLTPATAANRTLEELKMGYTTDSIFISAKRQTGTDELKKELYDRVSAKHKERFPFNNFLY